MKTISELELPYLSLGEPHFAADPFTPFSQARQQHPWLAKCSFAYVLTSYRAMRELMAHDSSMAVGYSAAVDLMDAGDTPWGQFIKRAIQNQTGALHKRLRDVVAPAFTPREANRHRALMREVISRLLDEWVPRRRFDFELFASHFPITVMCRVIGASPDVVPQLRTSLEALGAGGSFERSYLPRFQESFGVVDAFVRELVAARRAQGRRDAQPDLLDRLLSINNEGGLSDEELFNLLDFLFTAAYDTSKNVLTLIMHLLLDRPADYERCATDKAFCQDVLNETLRYHGVSSSPRVVLEDVVVRDVLIPQGTLLFLPWSISGRDPEAFDNPDVFDPERPKRNPVMPFGLGPHMCLGQHIAKAQIEEGLPLIAQRIKQPKRAGDVSWREFPGVWGLRGLPIEFEPG